MPLAAAASVAFLAVGLVRLIPRERYQAVPTPELERPGETPELDPAARLKQDSASDTERSADGQLYAVPSAPPSRDEAVTTEEVRSATPAEAAENDQASVEQAAKASEQTSEAQAPATATAYANHTHNAGTNPPASRN